MGLTLRDAYTGSMSISHDAMTDERQDTHAANTPGLGQAKADSGWTAARMSTGSPCLTLNGTGLYGLVMLKQDH